MEILTHITNFLLSQSWQIAVLAGVIAVASVAARNRSAHVRYLLWLIVLAKCFVPPLHTVTLAILPQAEQTESVAVSVPPMEVVAYQPVRTVVTEPLELPSVPIPEPKAPTIFDRLVEITTPEWLGIGWAVGVAVFVLVALVKAWRTNRWLKKRRRQMPAKMQRAIDEFFAEAGIKTIPKVWLVKGVGQPFVWGLVRGSIYLPHSFQAGNTARCRRAVLGHELSHVLRFDAAVNLLQVIAQGIFWFHPLVWWANKRIRAEREKCCDETAIARLNALPKDYSRAIVNTLIAEHKSTRPVPSLAIAGPVKNIEDRIKTIMKSGKKFYRRPTFITITTVLLLAAIAVPTTLALTRKAERMPDDIESALIEGFCENRDKFKCGALAWTIKTIDEGLIEPSRPRMETEGRYQMWWDGKKIATKYVRDQVVKDPGGRYRIEKERGGNSYNGSSLSRKPRFDYEENWLEYVIRWSGPVTIDKEIPALKKRENIALDFSTVVVDGRKLIRLETRNMDETAVDYRAYSLRYFDPSKGYCLVNRELYTTDDRLRTRCKFKLREVIPGGWFPVEVDLKGLSIKDGTVYLQRHLALDIGRCSFNDRTAIPGDIFKAGIRKLLKEQDKLIEMLAGFTDVKEIDESDSVRRGAREGAEMFLAAVRAADFEKAGELSYGKGMPVDEVKGWRRETKGQDLRIVAVFADDWSAMVICSVFQGDRGEVSPLTFYLGRVALDGHDEWQVHDTDVGTVDETERDLRQFLKKYPQAKQVPELQWGEAVEPVSVPLPADFESLTVEISGMWFWWQHPKFKINSDGSVDFSVGKGPKDAARYSTAFKLKRAHLQQLNKLLSETGWLTKAGANVEPGYTDASRIDITLMREGMLWKVWCHDRNAEPYGSLVNFLKRIYRQEYLLKRMTDADKQERLDALREIEQELRDAEDEPVAAYPYPVLDYDRLVPGCVEVVTHTKDNYSDAIVTALKLLGLRGVESVRETITELTTAEQVSSKPGYSRAKTEYVRAAAVEALTALGGEQARQHLRYMARNHGSWDRSVNEPIVEGLLKLDGTNSADLLKDMTRSTERAAWGLIRLGEAGIPAIVEILQKKYDPDDGSQVYLIREYIDHWEEIPKPLDKRITDAVYDSFDLRLRISSSEREYHEKLLRMAGVPERKRENARGIAETFLAAVVAGNESMIAKLADPLHARWANEVKALRELPELEKLKIAEVYAQRKDNDGMALAVTSGFRAGREENSRVLIYLGLCSGMAWRVGSINIAEAESADRGLKRFLEKYTGAELVPARAFTAGQAKAAMAVDVEGGWGEVVDGLQFGLECMSDKKVCMAGENVRFAFKIRNVSGEKIELEYVRPNFDNWAPTVRDMTGRVAPVLPPLKLPPSASIAFGFGGGEVVPQTLEPGEEVKLDETAFMIRAIGWEGQIERTVVFARAGKCKVSHTLVFSPSYGGRGRYLWRGQLTSGELELEVLPTEETLAAMPTGSKAAIETVLRLLGDYVSHGLLAGPSGSGADSWRINRQSWEQRCLALRASKIDYLGHVAAEHPEHGYRVAACEALGETQKAEAARLLIRPLGDDAAVVRRTAARALGHLRAQEHIPELLGLLESDPDSGVRVGAAIALGHIGSDRATNGLVAALQSDRNPEVRRFAALSLGWITDPAALPALRQVMKDTTDAELKQSLKNVIRNIEDPNYWGLGIKRGVSRREARTDEQPWGEAVEGLRCRLRADKTVWEAGEVPTLKMEVRNDGQSATYIPINDVTSLLEVNGQWHRRREWSKRGGKSELEPGERYEIKLELRNSLWFGKETGEDLEVEPGKYVLCAGFAHDPGNDAMPATHVSNPVDIEILPLKEKVAWGKAVDGLQFGLAFDGEKRAYAPGEGLTLRRYVRNTGDSEVPLSWSDLSLKPPSVMPPKTWHTMEIIDGRASPNGGGVHIVPNNTILLKPGETRMLGKTKYRDMLPPGKYRISQSCEFSITENPREDYPNYRSILLTTGELEFVVEPGPDVAWGKADVPWGEAVEGVQCRLRPDRVVWQYGETPTFKVDIRNRGKREVLVCVRGRYCDLRYGGQWYHRDVGDTWLRTLAPGQQHDGVYLSCGKGWHVSGGKGLHGQDRLELSAGKHTVQVGVLDLSANDIAEYPVLFISNPVEIEILSDDPAGPSAGDSEWRNQALENLTFGPVIERVVACRKGFPSEAVPEPGPMYLDLDTGTYVGFKALPTSEMIRSSGVDVYYEPVARGAGMWLTTSNLQLQPMSEKTGWDRNPGFVRRALVVASPYHLTPLERAPLAFMTRDGGIGILQILGFTKNRQGIRIRYKIAQNGATKKTDVEVGAEGTWGQLVEGVQIRLRADKVKWEVSETPMLKADIRNRGTHQLYVVQHQGLCELWRDGRWYSWAGEIRAKSSPLGPGREYNDIPILLDEHWVSKSNGKPLRLSRRHMVRLAFTTQPSDPKQGEVIRVHSNPVEIEILPAEAGTIVGRIESAEKLKLLGQAIFVYSNANENKYPESLHQLREDGYIVQAGWRWLIENVEYLGKGQDAANLPDAVLAYDRSLLRRKRGVFTNVLFNDGRVALRDTEQLSELGIWPVVFPDEAVAAIDRFRQALKESAWQRALSYCSDKVETKAKEYQSTEAFFRAVVPIDAVVRKSNILRHPAKWDYTHFIGGVHFPAAIPEHDIHEKLWWQVHVRKTDAGWIIYFETKTIQARIEQLKEDRIRSRQRDIERKARRKAFEWKLKRVKARTQLTAVSEEFVLGEPMLFRLELINEGREQFLFNSQWVTISLSLTIVDQKGDRAAYLVDPVQSWWGEYKPIEPGGSVVLFDNLDIAGQYDISKPGRYKVQFNGKGLETVIDTGEQNKDPADNWIATGRTFPSNIVEIEVVSPGQK